MYQNIIASSDATIAHNFKMDVNTNKHSTMQKYNRVFIMKDNTPNTYHLACATARVITDATQKKRQRDGLNYFIDDPVASDILSHYGIKRYTADGLVNSDLKTKDLTTKKITGIEPTYFMRIENESLFFLTDEQKDEIIRNLDIEKYIDLLESTYNENWYNEIGEYPFKIKEKTKNKSKSGGEKVEKSA